MFSLPLSSQKIIHRKSIPLDFLLAFCFLFFLVKLVGFACLTRFLCFLIGIFNFLTIFSFSPFSLFWIVRWFCSWMLTWIHFTLRHTNKIRVADSYFGLNKLGLAGPNASGNVADSVHQQQQHQQQHSMMMAPTNTPPGIPKLSRKFRGILPISHTCVSFVSVHFWILPLSLSLSLLCTCLPSGLCVLKNQFFQLERHTMHTDSLYVDKNRFNLVAPSFVCSLVN